MFWIERMAQAHNERFVRGQDLQILINRDGEVIEPLDEAQIIEAIQRLKAFGCEAVAVCLLWSIRNDAHERAIGKLLAKHMPNAAVSLSSEVQPVLREYTRMSCTALNAMLQPGVFQPKFSVPVSVLFTALSEHSLHNPLRGVYERTFPYVFYSFLAD